MKAGLTNLLRTSDLSKSDIETLLDTAGKVCQETTFRQKASN
jgi:aspartate carbamoyltransferase catalytic subunit